MLTILHISDIHFGTKHRWGKEPFPPLEKSIVNIMLKNNEKPEVIVITGDICSDGSREDYKEALIFLTNLIKEPPFTKVRDVLLTPGNHDYHWDKSSRKKTIKNLYNREANFRNFREAISDLIEKKVGEKRSSNDPDLINNIGKEMKKHLLDLVFIKKVEEHCAFLLISLNSMKIDSQEHRGIGYFKQEQLETVSRISKFYRDRLDKSFELTIVAICHHHLLPVHFIEYDYFKTKKKGNQKKGETSNMSRKTSVTLDAGATLDLLQEIGCRIVFHGHQHQPACREFRDLFEGPNKNKKPESINRRIYIVGAGSIGCGGDDLGSIARNHFFIHRLSSRSLNVQSYTGSPQNSQIFVTDETFSSNLQWASQSSLNEDCVLSQIIPEGSTRIKKLETKEDFSSLFFLFLNVIDCKKTRDIIRKYAERYPDIKIEAMFDLYGRYDSLIRYRETSKGQGRQFEKDLKKHLQSDDVNQLRHGTRSRFCDITNEIGPESRLILPGGNEYRESLWTLGWLEVFFSQSFVDTVGIRFNEFHNELESKFEDKKLISNAAVSSIREMIVQWDLVGEDSVILELQMSCEQFRHLNLLSNLIESVIDIRRLDKSTHIAYAYERVNWNSGTKI